MGEGKVGVKNNYFSILYKCRKISYYFATRLTDGCVHSRLDLPKLNLIDGDYLRLIRRYFSISNFLASPVIQSWQLLPRGNCLFYPNPFQVGSTVHAGVQAGPPFSLLSNVGVKFGTNQSNALQQPVKRDEFVKTSPFKIGGTGYFAKLPEFEKNLPQLLNGLSQLWHPNNSSEKPLPVIVAIDDSPMSRKLLPQVTQHFLNKGVDVYTYFVNKDKTPLPLPLGEVSFFTKNFYKLKHPHPKVAGSVMLTAGSRGWHWGGLRVLDNQGWPFDKEQTAQLQKVTDEASVNNAKSEPLKCGKERNLFGETGHYSRYLLQLVNFPLIKKLETKIIFDPCHGSGKEGLGKYLDSWVDSMFVINHDNDINNPYSKNSGLFHSKKLLNAYQNESNDIEYPNKIGIRNNSDCSEIQIIDEDGKSISNSDLTCLMIKHLVENKKKYGLVIKSSELSGKIEELASIYGLPIDEIPLGFQYVNTRMKQAKDSKDNVLIAASGKGQITSIGGMPVPDSHFNNFRLLEALGFNNGARLSDLVSEIDNNLKNHYSWIRFKIFRKDPEAFWRKVLLIPKRFSKIGIASIDSYKTALVNKMLAKVGADEKQMKIILKDGSFVFVRQQRHKPELFDVVFEKRTPKTFFKYQSNQRHKNYTDVVFEKVKELLFSL